MDSNDIDTTKEQECLEGDPCLLQESERVAYLILLNLEGQTNRIFRLEKEVTTIGRSLESDLTLDHESVSRRHAEVHLTRGVAPKLVDLGSLNGTKVNGERITTSSLSDGDLIQIGPTIILRFSFRDSREAQIQGDLYNLATRDSLTGLHNRHYLMEALQKALNHCCRNKSPISLLSIDIDRFKQVNDSRGHLAGDHVLRELGTRLSETFRADDVVGRVGGDELMVLMPDCDEAGASASAERLRKSVAEAKLEYHGEPITVTISIGVASHDGKIAMSSEELLELVDKCLYDAKRDGSNCVRSLNQM